MVCNLGIYNVCPKVDGAVFQADFVFGGQDCYNKPNSFLLNDEGIERVGLHRAYNELTQAENVLINWTQTAIKTEPEFMQNSINFEELYEKVKTDAEARGAILNLAMRLNLELV